MNNAHGRSAVWAVTMGLLLGGVLAAAQGTVPTPESVIGFAPGSDYHLADFEQISAYFQKLAAASPRIRLMDIGKTGLGRTMFVAFISSQQNLQQLDHYRQIAVKLGLGEGDAAAAHQMAAEGKAIVWIDGGMHASEVAGAQHTSTLAYRLVTSEDPDTKLIRDNVILILCPVINPDGLDIVAHWYMKNVGTPYELAPVPVLWNKYVGHDNNRDWYKFNEVESRDVAQIIYHSWIPEIIYNQHQSSPFPGRIFVPPFADPVNSDIPPEVVRGVNLVGSAMEQRFAAEHKSGVVSRMDFDMWWNGGMREAPYYHNQIGILTETGLFDYATPGYYPPDKLPATFPDGTSARIPSIFYPDPWKGGWWHLSDADEYMITGDMGVLDIAARLREHWLYNIWAMAQDQIQAGAKGGPYAYLVPPDQHDPTATGDMLFSLQTGGIAIRQATAPFTAEGQNYPAGTKVMLASQPFRPFLVDLMDPQHYPDERLYPGGPPKRPYDMTGWTMPLQMGVNVVRVNDPVDIQTAPVTVEEPVHQFAPPVGQKIGRVGLYESWMANMDAGQTRYVFDHWHIPYTPLHDADIRAGDLRAKFDVIILPDQAPDAILHGWQNGRAGGYGGAGRPAVQRPQYVGGIGVAGLAALYQFVDQGGSILCFDHAGDLLINEFGLPVRNVLAGLSSSQFYAPGSLLRINVDPDLPETHGMLPQSVAFFVSSSAYQVWDTKLPAGPPRFNPDQPAPTDPINDLGDHDGVRILATYGSPHPLLSGWILGDQRVTGRVAAVSLPVGQGRVILIGFRPQFRAQSENTYPLIFNSLLVPSE